MLHFSDTRKSWLCCGQIGNWPSVSWKKLAKVKDCVIVPTYREGRYGTEM